MPVRIDETRHAYHVCGINFLCLGVLDIFTDRRDAITINQNTSAWNRPMVSSIVITTAFRIIVFFGIIF